MSQFYDHSETNVNAWSADEARAAIRLGEILKPCLRISEERAGGAQVVKCGEGYNTKTLMGLYRVLRREFCEEGGRLK